MTAAKKLNREPLVRAFRDAGLDLRLLEEPINKSNEDIFQFRIGRSVRGNRRDEWFELWPGHADNRIEVIAKDSAICQVVLFVHETARSFEQTIGRGIVMVHKHTDGLDGMLRANGLTRKDVIVYEPNKDLLRVRMGTSDAKRHFLAGLDERQLFVCRLPPKAASTVAQAHASLKRPEVTFFEGKAPGRTVRQGEWFFVNLTPSELQALEGHIKAGRSVIEKKIPIGAANDSRRRQNGGNPHTADELVKGPAPRLSHGFTIRGDTEIYVRGKVTHVDHATVSFKHWRKVIRNNEPGQASGVYWID